MHRCTNDSGDDDDDGNDYDNNDNNDNSGRFGVLFYLKSVGCRLSPMR